MQRSEQRRDEIEVERRDDRIARACAGGEFDQRLAFGDHFAVGDEQPAQRAAARGFDGVEHFHGFDDHQQGAGADDRAGGDGNFGDDAGDRGADDVTELRVNDAWHQRGGDFGHDAIDKTGVEIGGGDFGAVEQRQHRRDIGIDTVDAKPRQRPARLGEEVRRIDGADDQFRRQRVEARVGGAADGDAAVDADAGPGGGIEADDASRRGTGAAVGRDGFEVDADLHRRAARRQGPRAQPQVGERCAKGDADLDGDKVDPVDFFGDGVFDLEPGVGLDEGDGAIGGDEKLERREAVEPGGQRAGGVEKRRACRGRQARGGGELDQFLAAALQAAIAIGDDADGGAVADRLDLDMARRCHEGFGIDAAIAEGRLCFGAGQRQRRRDIVVGTDDADAATATAGDRLDRHLAGRAEAGEQRHDLRGTGPRREPCRHRHAARGGMGASRRLVAETIECCRVGANEHQSGGGAVASKAGVFAEETIARVDGDGGMGARGGDDRGAIEIGGGAGPRQCHGSVADTRVKRAGIVGGMDHDDAHPEVGKRRGDAHRHLAAVGDQDGRRHEFDHRYSRARATGFVKPQLQQATGLRFSHRRLYSEVSGFGPSMAINGVVK